MAHLRRGRRGVPRLDPAPRRRSPRSTCRCSSWRSWCRSTWCSAWRPPWRWCAGGSADAALIQAVVDLPFAVSPIVVGVSLILLWGVGRLVRRSRAARLQGHLRPAGHGDRHALRHAAVRRARGRAGAARDRHRAGAGRLHARRQHLADLLADHPAGDPLGPDLRRRAHHRPRARRVRRGDHGQLRLPRGLPDAHPARPLALHRRPQHLRRLRRGHPAHGAGRAHAARHDRCSTARGERHDHRHRRPQELRRLRRPRRRHPRHPRGLAHRPARARAARASRRCCARSPGSSSSTADASSSAAATSPASPRRSAASGSSSSTMRRSST